MARRAPSIGNYCSGAFGAVSEFERSGSALIQQLERPAECHMTVGGVRLDPDLHVVDVATRIISSNEPYD
jgi:hypothetical protein